ncbi:MAG TPA: glycosyltransferase [Bacteroidia bacterium]|nr:glycosyltransferase [Bacteroidia bacterium]
MNKRKRILIAPLDWGLGHATRCIPVIKLLLEKDAEVIIAADGRAAQLLKEEFPSLKHIHLTGYRIRYSKTFGITLMIALQIPKIILSVIREYSALKKIILDEQPDVVISDNRFGLWNKKIRSVFITHQLMVKCPPALKFCEPIIHRIILFFVKKYDECWVPDVEGEKNLSGDLSHKYPLPANTKFIGWLSRFDTGKKFSAEIKYDLLALLSGTEPQRTVLEKILIEQIQKTNYKTLLVRGVTEEQKQFIHQNNLTIVSHLNSHELLTAINESGIILCRSGYSTLMDLAATGKKAILIPTPGQTEQEYLAEELSAKKFFFSALQKIFSLAHAMQAVKNTTSLQKEKFISDVEKSTAELLKK